MPYCQLSCAYKQLMFSCLLLIHSFNKIPVHELSFFSLFLGFLSPRLSNLQILYEQNQLGIGAAKTINGVDLTI